VEIEGEVYRQRNLGQSEVQRRVVPLRARRRRKRRPHTGGGVAGVGQRPASRRAPAQKRQSAYCKWARRWNWRAPPATTLALGRHKQVWAQHRAVLRRDALEDYVTGRVGTYPLFRTVWAEYSRAFKETRCTAYVE
jgi:hypothetical protein